MLHNTKSDKQDKKKKKITEKLYDKKGLKFDVKKD